MTTMIDGGSQPVAAAPTASTIRRDRAGLLAALDAVDSEGWDGPTGRTLLGYVRATVVRPQVAAVGLRGPAAEQAEATGWAVAWELLAGDSLRTALSPWGVLWTAVRRAVLGEVVAAAYGTAPRTGWRLAATSTPTNAVGRGEGRSAVSRPVSLSALERCGWEPAAPDPVGCGELGRRLSGVVAALVTAGWDQPSAGRVVEAIAVDAARDGKASPDARGWRPLAARLELPPWRVRRVMVLLLGAPGWPGLVERMVTEGEQVIHEPAVAAAIRSTLVAWRPTPAAARLARSGSADRQRASGVAS